MSFNSKDFSVVLRPTVLDMVVVYLLLGVLFIGGFLLLIWFRTNPQFGGKIGKAERKAYARSKQWNGKKFTNLTDIQMSPRPKDMPRLLKAFFSGRAAREPRKPLPILPFDAKKWQQTPELPKFVWYGHSVLLLYLEGKTILIDPMFGPNASPIAPFATKRFSQNSLDIIDSLPNIDLLLMTHDHYDHLDYDSMLKLKSKVSLFYVALGVKRHLVRWGFDANNITEFDWWQTEKFGNIEFTFTPSNHSSGRGIASQQACLWGGWVFKSATKNIYWSGDGGYGNHFKTIGDKFGPFDWAFMECGQFNENWHDIHMFPEEAVRAGLDANAKVLTPVHWGGFALALHPWQFPADEFDKAASARNAEVFYPKLGEIVAFDTQPRRNKWWTGIN